MASKYSPSARELPPPERLVRGCDECRKQSSTKPTTSHTTNRSQVSLGKLTINAPETMIARMGTRGTHGVRNGR